MFLKALWVALAKGGGGKIESEAGGGGGERLRKQPDLKVLSVCPSHHPTVSPSAALVLGTLQGQQQASPRPCS